jgi:hypothetical protein
VGRDLCLRSHRRGHSAGSFYRYRYAVASATAILTMRARAKPSLKDMLVSNILAVDKHEVVNGCAHGVVGLFSLHLSPQVSPYLRKPAEAEARGMNIRFWDFLFYASFGSLLDFFGGYRRRAARLCYLLLPSVGAMRFADRVRTAAGHRLDHGYSGFCLGGLLFCTGDLPTGATIVCTFGGVLVVMFFVHLIFFRGHRVQPLEGASSSPIPSKPWCELGLTTSQCTELSNTSRFNRRTMPTRMFSSFMVIPSGNSLDRVLVDFRSRNSSHSAEEKFEGSRRHSRRYPRDHCPPW